MQNQAAHPRPASLNGCRDTLNLYLNGFVVVLCAGLPLYRKWVSIAVPVILLLWFLEGRLGDKMRALRRSPVSLAIVAFVAFNLLSLAWSSESLAGLDYLLKYRYLLLVPIIATSLRPGFRVPALTAGAIGMALSLLLLFLNSAGILPQVDAPPSNPSVTMSHLDYSMFLALVPLLIIVYLLSVPSAPPRRRWLLLGLGMLCFAGLAVNIGRSGQLAFFGSLIIVVPASIRSGRWWKLATGMVATILLFGLAYVSFPRFRERAVDAVTEVVMAVRGQEYDTNQGTRIAASIVAGHMIRERPVLGTGVGDNMIEFRRLLATRYQQFEDAVAWFPHMHNQYLQVATETGLVGLFLLLNILVQLQRSSPDDHVARLGALALGAVFALGFLGDPYFHKQMPVALFGTVGGLLLAPQLSVWIRPRTPRP